MSIYEKISILLSLFAAGISLYVFFTNKLYSVAELENEIFSKVNTSLSELRSALEDYIAFKNDTTEMGVLHKNAYTEALKSVLSSYNYACMQYEKKLLDKKHFKNLYAAQINHLFSDARYTDFINDAEAYPYLNRFRQKNQK